MNTPIAQWYKASDGSAAVDMQVALVTPWFRCGPKDRPSLQVAWPDGPVGAFSLQFTDAKPDTDVRGKSEVKPTDFAGAIPTNYPADAIAPEPTQPSGTQDNTILCVDSAGEWVRGLWTPTVGQEAASANKLPSAAWISYTESIEE